MKLNILYIIVIFSLNTGNWIQNLMYLGKCVSYIPSSVFILKQCLTECPGWPQSLWSSCLSQALIAGMHHHAYCITAFYSHESNLHILCWSFHKRHSLGKFSQVMNSSFRRCKFVIPAPWEADAVRLQIWSQPGHLSD